MWQEKWLLNPHQKEPKSNNPVFFCGWFPAHFGGAWGLFYHRNKQGNILLEAAIPIAMEEGIFLPYCNIFFPLRHNNPKMPDCILHDTCAPRCDPELQQWQSSPDTTELFLCEPLALPRPHCGAAPFPMCHTKSFLIPSWKPCVHQKVLLPFIMISYSMFLRQALLPRTQATFSVLQYFSKPVKIRVPFEEGYNSSFFFKALE